MLTMHNFCCRCALSHQERHVWAHACALAGCFRHLSLVCSWAASWFCYRLLLSPFRKGGLEPCGSAHTAGQRRLLHELSHGEGSSDSPTWRAPPGDLKNDFDNLTAALEVDPNTGQPLGAARAESGPMDASSSGRLENSSSFGQSRYANGSVQHLERPISLFRLQCSMSTVCRKAG